MTHPHHPHGTQVYVKRHDEWVADDWVLVRRFANQIAHVPGVRTASPLWCDESQGCIGYERLSDLHPLLSRGEWPADETLRTIGARLAAFHAVPVSGAANAYPLESLGLSRDEALLLSSTLPAGMFWGDCWHGNIFVPAWGEVIFLDPVPNRWLFDRGHDVACGAIDIAMLHMSLYLCHPLHHLLRVDPQAALVKGSVLLRAYLDTCAATALYAPLVRLSRLLAGRYVEAYRRRLSLPIAILKEHASRRILARVDHILDREST